MFNSVDDNYKGQQKSLTEAFRETSKELMRILFLLLLLTSSCTFIADVFMGGDKNLDSSELYLNQDIKAQVYSRNARYKIDTDSKLKENINSSLFDVYKLDLEDISSFEVTSSAKSFFIADKKSNLYWFKKNNDKFLKRTLLKGDSPITAISLSPDETKLVVAQFSSASIFDLNEMKIISKQKKIKGRIKSVAWGKNNDQVAFGLVSGGVYVWRLDRKIKNSVEVYESESNSPIIGIAFLPSSEAMFTASRQGEIKIWRLIKADQELGFYDPNALIDQDKEAQYSKEVAVLDTQLENIWLDKNNLFVSSSDGDVYGWKLRGLKPLGKLKADLRGVLSSGSINSEMFFTTGREQNLKLWCVNSLASESTEIGALSSAKIDKLALYRSGIFESTLNLAKITSGQLWAYEKTGNLISLDFSRLNISNKCNASGK